MISPQSRRMQTQAIINGARTTAALALPTAVFCAAAAGTPVAFDTMLGGFSVIGLYQTNGGLVNSLAPELWFMAAKNRHQLHMLPYVMSQWAKSHASTKTEAAIISAMLELSYHNHSSDFEEFMALYFGLACGSPGRETLGELLLLDEKHSRDARSKIKLSPVDTIWRARDNFPPQSSTVSLRQMPYVSQQNACQCACMRRLTATALFHTTGPGLSTSTSSRWSLTCFRRATTCSTWAAISQALNSSSINRTKHSSWWSASSPRQSSGRARS